MKAVLLAAGLLRRGYFFPCAVSGFFLAGLALRSVTEATGTVPVGVSEQPDTILPFPALVKELALQFAIAYTREDFETVIAMLAQGRIDASPMVTDIVSLDDMPEAFEALRTPSHQCKVLTKL